MILWFCELVTAGNTKVAGDQILTCVLLKLVENSFGLKSAEHLLPL